MRIILFGATGMVGAGTLREALADPDVQAVLSVSRRSCGEQHPKLRELLLPDLFEFAAAEPSLAGWDACLWAVGISSVGLDEAAYAKVTEELTLRWARALLRLNPGFSFCYCSAAGADGGSMWARVRRRVEAELKAIAVQAFGLRAAGLHPAGPRNPHTSEDLSSLHRLVPAIVSAAGLGRSGPGHHFRAARAGDAARGQGPGRPLHPRIRRHQSRWTRDTMISTRCRRAGRIVRAGRSKTTVVPARPIASTR